LSSYVVDAFVLALFTTDMTKLHFYVTSDNREGFDEACRWNSTQNLRVSSFVYSAHYTEEQL